MGRKLKLAEKGKKYNKLTLIKDLGLIKLGLKNNKRRLAVFLCDCGKEKIIRLDQVKSGIAKSCGCLQKSFALSGKARYKHGDSNTRFYKIWACMNSRTRENLQEKYFKSYGKLKIKICKRWKSYPLFKKDMYQSYTLHCKEFGTKQTSIDRINTYGDYKPSNCKWSTYSEQMLNTSKQYGK